MGHRNEKGRRGQGGSARFIVLYLFQQLEDDIGCLAPCSEELHPSEVRLDAMVESGSALKRRDFWVLPPPIIECVNGIEPCSLPLSDGHILVLRDRLGMPL